MSSRGGQLQWIDTATVRLRGMVDTMPASDLAADSRLPGWTRGHVVAHLALGAQAMARLVVAAGEGRDGTAYVSEAARAADIEAGARRRRLALIGMFNDSATALREAFTAMSPDAGARPVSVLGGRPLPVEQLVLRRVVELELHAVDLAWGYEPAHWPASFAGLDLPEPLDSQRASRLPGRR